MQFQCWHTVFDAGPTLKQHWVNAPCLPGLLWVHDNYNFFNSFSAGTVFIRQNLRYKDGPRSVRFNFDFIYPCVYRQSIQPEDYRGSGRQQGARERPGDRARYPSNVPEQVHLRDTRGGGWTTDGQDTGAKR